jgi:hypothetical protein
MVPLRLSSTGLVERSQKAPDSRRYDRIAERRVSVQDRTQQGEVRVQKHTLRAEGEAKTAPLIASGEELSNDCSGERRVGMRREPGKGVDARKGTLHLRQDLICL